MQQEIIRDYLSPEIGTFSKVYIDGEKGGGLFIFLESDESNR